MRITLSMWPQRRRPNTTGSRTVPKPFLDDAQWNSIKDLFANPLPSPLGGRPRVEPRPCLEGILWVLKSGGRWQDLPERYPSPATCWRRLKEWTERGIMVKTWERLLKSLDRQKRLNWSQAMGDGTFSPAKKGAPRLVRPRKAKERNSC
ncbi:transposase [Schlesneria sp. DSM 10557]|uniref:transposase n=2 Tax=Schlesneria sp. DSM 10557 TaxID=3044399 RepID=UPI0035A0132D